MSSLNFVLDAIKLPGREAPDDLWQKMVTVVKQEVGAPLQLSLAILEAEPWLRNHLQFVLAHLSEEEFAHVLDRAVSKFKEGSTSEHIESIVAQASLQFPHLLTGYLITFQDRIPNEGTYYDEFPWRSASDEEISTQLVIIRDETIPFAQRRLAWNRLLQTKRPDVIEQLIPYFNTLRIANYEGRPPEFHELFKLAEEYAELAGFPNQEILSADLNTYLYSVGFKFENGVLDELDMPQVYHVRFPDDFFDYLSLPPWLAREHPTWRLDADPSFTAEFGGVLQSKCGLCNSPLHRLLDFSPVPSGLDVSDMSRLVLATCLSCLGWEESELFYSHDEQGMPFSLESNGIECQPEFVISGLSSAKIQLCPSPARWRTQDWGLSHNENLNRLGGSPCWIQDSYYPICPKCENTMRFVAQLDSRLPTQEGEEFLWGSGGIGYAFWCDACQISAWTWQCT